MDEFGNKIKVKRLSECKPNELKNGLFVDNVGNQLWYKNNLLHNDKGVSNQYINGGQEWYKNGVKHRDNGPAVIHDDGNYTVWYLNGIQTTEEEVMMRWKAMQEKKMLEKTTKLLSQSNNTKKKI